MELTTNSLRRLGSSLGGGDDAMFRIALLAFAAGCGTLLALDAEVGDVAATATVPPQVEALFYFPAQFAGPSGDATYVLTGPPAPSVCPLDITDL